VAEATTRRSAPLSKARHRAVVTATATGLRFHLRQSRKLLRSLGREAAKNLIEKLHGVPRLPLILGFLHQVPPSHDHSDAIPAGGGKHLLHRSLVFNACPR
jgi:hypothetical protein